MTKIFSFLLLITLSAEVYAQKEKNDIHAAVIGLFNGLSLFNIDTLNYYSTSDFHLLEDGEVWNMDTLVNKIMPGKNANVTRINTFRFIRTVQNGNTAWVSYHNSAEFSMGEKKRVVNWMESAALVKDKGRWKIQMLHSTRLK